uniref:proton-conducting transporter transmembrane domain-containing protein n=1 Tax=Falsiroseomonas oryzae TaxID=2766473 RepID=UPI0022EA3367
MARFFTSTVWLAFGLLLLLLAFSLDDGPLVSAFFRADALTLFLGAAVALVSGVVHGFAARHMEGDARYQTFFNRLSTLTILVLLLLATDWVPLFAVLWVAMGMLLADAIGHARRWPQAAAAAEFAQRWFLAGAGALILGLGLLSLAADSLSIATIVYLAPKFSPVVTSVACAALAVAAAIQCGLFPFHRWLMSSMTAPTPVSAFMHAGLVNAGGILVARFAPVFEQAPGVLLVLFLVGAVSALFGQLAALVQNDVKRGLAASTTAQMGFMLMQCGLGFHAAAMAHLVLHGLYKASLFLGAGSALAAARAPAAAARPGAAA